MFGLDPLNNGEENALILVVLIDPLVGAIPVIDEFVWMKSLQLWLAVISVGFSFTFAALSGFPDSLALGVFFALWSDLANVLFQGNAFRDMSRPLALEDAEARLVSPSRCRSLCLPPFRKWWGFPFSLIGNTPLIIAAWAGIDRYVSNYETKVLLKILSIIGGVSESLISVKGAGDLPGILKDLWSERRAHPIALSLAVILGNLTAIGFSANGVGAIQQALKRFLPDSAHKTIDSDPVYAALWVPNLYPLAFGMTFGMDGFFALFSKVLPGIFSSDEKLGYLFAALLVGLSVGPSVGVALASRIDGGPLSILSSIGIASCVGTNLAPLTIRAALKTADKTLAFFGFPKKELGSVTALAL
ncbi:MAG: hypothetical protein NTV32_05475 [Gammaproteobacteria bacterium]|nr:hypothetical protein [Gammaproteobacteria bacterium]